MRTAAQGVRSTASRGLSRLYRAALIGALALLVVSCRSTKKVTETAQMQQTARASASLDSSASLSQTVESLKVATVTDEQWTEQTYNIIHLPDGNLQIVTLSHQKQQTHSSGQTKTTLQQTAAAMASRKQEQEEEKKNDVRTATEQPSNGVWRILCIWLAGIIALVGIGYILVRHQYIKNK